MHILIVIGFLFGPVSGPVTAMQEFLNLENCENASKEVQALARNTNTKIVSTCVPK